MALFGYLCRVPQFIVTPLMMGPVCLLVSQGRFEEPVRPWLYVLFSIKRGLPSRSGFAINMQMFGVNRLMQCAHCRLPPPSPVTSVASNSN